MRTGPVLLAVCAILAGCASPGPPLPPSLNLPAVVEAGQLSAVRSGDAVELHWTTPTRNTDRLLIKGPVTAVICRDAPPSPVRQGQRVTAPPCSAVEREQVMPGPSDAVDVLPNALAAGPARLVAYRVELFNSAGRTAGPSEPVLVPAGAAPAAVADLRVEDTKDGALLRWSHPEVPPNAPGGHPEAPAQELSTIVELTRTTQAAEATPAGAAAKPTLPGGIAGEGKEPAVMRFQAGNVDAGGTLDRTAQIGHTYTYTAQRVRTVTLGGQSYQLRSAPSAPVTVSMRDVFPPAVPGGLVAVPAFVGEGEAQKPAIDLSWEPDVEARVAGYLVYRREGAGAWQRLTAEPVAVAAYRDAAVTAGRSYTYRVTAVSDAGYESAPSNEVGETAPTL